MQQAIIILELRKFGPHQGLLLDVHALRRSARDAHTLHERLIYHGYHFYNASTPESPYNQFKLGYWYHNGSHINNIYYGSVNDYYEACKHACKVS